MGLAIVDQNHMPYFMFTKGSPELTLERCTHIGVSGQIKKLTEAQCTKILQQNNALASRGLRVLRFSYKTLDEIPPESSEDRSKTNLIWLGLVGMLDAPRPEVRECSRTLSNCGHSSCEDYR
jgi:Ca2+-transporting ATPase